MYALFDIGGTNTRVGIAKDFTTIEQTKIIPTPQRFEEGIAILKETIKELSGNSPIQGIAGGIAGPLAADKTTLSNSPHLPDWVKKPITKELQDTFNAPSYLENDAVIVGMGEAAHGAAKGYHIAAFLTVSTGIGGARFIDAKPDQNAMGFEPGHQIIDPKKSLCPDCKGPGTLENLASGTALENRFQKKAPEITDESVWEQLAEWLALGLNNTIVHWSPEIVILGGSMMTKTPGISIERVHFHLQHTLTVYKQLPKLELATLGDLGGLYGALAYLEQHHSS